MKQAKENERNQLRDKAEETDSLPDELAAEILFKGLGEELDPEDLVEQYQTLSEKYLAEAKELLSAGDLVWRKRWRSCGVRLRLR